MSFWERFYNLCIENNTRPNPLGSKLGIPSATIAGWKKGSYPNLLYLDKLANYFDCSVDYLIGKSDIKKEQTAKLQSDNEDINKLIEIGTKLSPEHLKALLVLADQLIEGQSEE